MANYRNMTVGAFIKILEKADSKATINFNRFTNNSFDAEELNLEYVEKQESIYTDGYGSNKKIKLIFSTKVEK